MAVSGTATFNLTRDEIITLAFQHLNIYTSNEAISPADKQYAASMLNMMVKTWQAQNIHLWKETEATLFLNLNQRSYSLSTSGDNATMTYVSTTLTLDTLSGATTITVDSTAGMTVGDYVGITVSSGDLEWTTISTIPDSTSFTIPAPGLSDSAVEGAAVYAYTDKIERPLYVFSSRRNSSADQDTPMWKLARQEYFDLPNKTNTGIPTSFYYDPQLNQGKIYIWPEPISTSDKVKFTFARPIFDFNTALNTPDFPAEWLLPITMQLAVLISPRYGKRNQIDRMKADADALLESIMQFDNEDASIYFQIRPY